MPVIGVSKYNINFSVLDSNDQKTIFLYDQSTYLTTPELPLIAVVPPGFTGCVEFAYTPSTIITINSASLNNAADQDLVDGVYQITMKVCPYDKLFKKRCYLKTTQFDEDFATFLLKLNISCGCIDPIKLERELIEIDILIQSAKAEVFICSPAKATEKYRAACTKLANLNKKLNCH